MNTTYKILLSSLFSVLILMTSCLEEDHNYAKDGALLNPVAYIYDVRESYNGSEMELGERALNGAYMTTGIVISDITENNIPKNNLIIQSTDPKSTATTTLKCIGLILNLNNAQDNIFVPGDSLVINLRGTKLVKKDGNLQVTGITLDKIIKVKSKVAVAPKTVTIKDLYRNFDMYASMLLQIDGGFDPLPESGDVLSGDRSLGAGKDSLVYLHTDAGAAFANRAILPSAQFTGIPFWNNNDRQFRMQRTSDIQYDCGPLYPNWPEDFETPSIKELGLYDAVPPGLVPRSMTSYNYSDNLGYLKTGKWLFFYSILVDPEQAGTLGRDRVSGQQGIRIQQKISTYNEEAALLEMMFDVPQGASKVTYTYGSYYTDAKSTFVLEYSIDKGNSWYQAHLPNSDPAREMRVSTTMLDIKVPVRFRIKKGMNSAVDGRLSIDNIYIYKGTW